jgi:hypothetical protein
MTDLTLEEFRTAVPEQELAAKLRDDAFMIRGPYTKSPHTGKDHEHKKGEHVLAQASRLFRLCFRAP